MAEMKRVFAAEERRTDPLSRNVGAVRRARVDEHAIDNFAVIGGDKGIACTEAQR